jgi:hypothetical protein
LATDTASTPTGRPCALIYREASPNLHRATNNRTDNRQNICHNTNTTPAQQVAPDSAASVAQAVQPVPATPASKKSPDFRAFFFKWRWVVYIF